ncbi:hypothetical protein ACFOY2_42775 [Nonomuraea purpurea]|uniref:Lipoprotein n=1 Tax=Nonomuraea purpurea TaxID=1849276 RepID=A0ABV8GJ84_9ACTN
MPTRSFLAMAALVTLAGCGGEPAARPDPSPASTPGARGEAQRIESIKADCMKSKGFRYVPFVRPETTGTQDDRKRAAGDYETLRAHRAKYGFGVSSILVHRDPGGGRAEMPENPNYAIRQDLSPAQQKTYAKTSDACEAQAIKQVTGETVTSADDWNLKRNVAVSRTLRRELDGDPELVRLATAMADCMRAKGHQITSISPMDMEEWGRMTFGRRLHELARKENPDIPAYDPENGQGYLPSRLTPAEQRQFLDQEVKAALDDLECGKDFRVAFRPKHDEVSARLWQE